MKFKKILCIALGVLIGIFIGIYICEPQPFWEFVDKLHEFVLALKDAVFNK